MVPIQRQERIILGGAALVILLVAVVSLWVTPRTAGVVQPAPAGTYNQSCPACTPVPGAVATVAALATAAWRATPTLAVTLDLRAINTSNAIRNERLVISGEVENPNDVPVDFVLVTATIYDARGVVLDTPWTYVDRGTAIAPKSKAPFQIISTQTTFATYSLRVSRSLTP
jgi:hypothetical protein